MLPEVANERTLQVRLTLTVPPRLGSHVVHLESLGEHLDTEVPLVGNVLRISCYKLHEGPAKPSKGDEDEDDVSGHSPSQKGRCFAFLCLTLR